MLSLNIVVKESNPNIWKQSGRVRNETLVNIAKFAAALVTERVLQKTQTAHGGQFPPYKKSSGKRKRFFWVGPEFVQPTTGRVGFKAISSDVSTKKVDRARVAYEDRGAYEEALGQGRSRRKKRFSMSGKMWEGLIVQVESPARVSVVFKKSSLGYTTTKANPDARSVSNAKKAQYAARSAGRHILEMSDSEVRRIVEYAFSIITKDSFKGFLDDEKLFQIRKLINKTQRHIKNIDNLRKSFSTK